MVLLKTILTVSLACIVSVAWAQDKKQVKKAHLKSQVIWVQNNRGIKNFNYKQKEMRYDNKGNCTEEIIFNRRGHIISHRVFEYEKKLMVHEIILDRKGKIIQRIEYKYRDEILVEKKFFNTEGKLTGTEQRIFEYQD
jgi:hypothetical protein